MGDLRDPPWVMRTYSGHTSARTSNTLFKTNLKKGQTGLSVAFDLPTQLGYDSDHPLALGEVGKVGVPICHAGDMELLFEGIPLQKTNTSMTINATSTWLLSLYLTASERQGVWIRDLHGTTQNDILKEYLSRGTHIFPPTPSVRLAVDLIAFALREIPFWNPINICSYHIQEAGATPVQELAFSLANAVAILDQVRESGQVSSKDFPKVVERVSFFVNAGIRFIEEMCKVRAFVRLWDEITRERYRIQDPKGRLFRYGVQVNSLGLTEKQPENNMIRIVLEMLAVTLSKEARARAIQLPAWNEALGLPRPWDQQWSLRAQQILAFETDLLEYGDIAAGSPVIEEKVEALVREARQELQKILGMGGAFRATDYLKQSLVASQRERIARIESGDQKVVGVNSYTEGGPSPLTGYEPQAFLKIDRRAEREQIQRLKRHRAGRLEGEVRQALEGLLRAAEGRENLLPPSIECARAGVTTGEWGETLRKVFGEYRAPTGIGRETTPPLEAPSSEGLRSKIRQKELKLGGPIRLLVGKPGLDGHSSGAEQIALRARDTGFEVIYPGIRLTPRQIVATAREEGVHVIGLSILSGSHVELISEIAREMRRGRGGRIPIVLGGIIPKRDRSKLKKLGVSRIFTPQDYELNEILSEIVDLAR